jgi:hypothetical protein
MTQAPRVHLIARGVLLLLRLAVALDCHDALLLGVAPAVLERTPGGGGIGAPQNSGQGLYGREYTRPMRY